MPLIVSPGNHESDSVLLPQFAFLNPPSPEPPAGYSGTEDSGGECSVPYEQRLQPPNMAPHKDWYSVDVGPVHFLQFSTEQNFMRGSEQYAFIKEDLARVDRALRPWVIVGFHRPM